jgi:hypothetical protein
LKRDEPRERELSIVPGMALAAILGIAPNTKKPGLLSEAGLLGDMLLLVWLVADG